MIQNDERDENYGLSEQTWSSPNEVIELFRRAHDRYKFHHYSARTQVVPSGGRAVMCSLDRLESFHSFYMATVFVLDRVNIAQ